MKFQIIGAGLSGCTLARLLADDGHEVEIIEKTSRVGGLCVTDIDKNGLKFEPYGARTFHTNDRSVIDFITRFSDFNGYEHRKGMVINDTLMPFPLTRSSLQLFPDRRKIADELAIRPKTVDNTNFETACISLFGKTLYRYFIGNYSQKMWGTLPTNLTAEWAPKRLEFRETDDDRLFGSQWQGLPVDGYSVWLEKMIEGIPISLNCDQLTIQNDATIVCSAPIDQLFDYRFGHLEYRSLKFDYEYDDTWEKKEYGTINLPQHPSYFRKCNFTTLYKEETEHNFIQYQRAVESDKNHIPMYPVNTEENNAKFISYLQLLCKEKCTFFPFGRLGLFKYLDMDKAVAAAFDMKNLVVQQATLSSNDKFAEIVKIRDKY